MNPPASELGPMSPGAEDISINREPMKRTILRLLITTSALVSMQPVLATDWSTQAYDLYFGDFNGDGKTDLLYIAKDPAGIKIGRAHV